MGRACPGQNGRREKRLKGKDMETLKLTLLMVSIPQASLWYLYFKQCFDSYVRYSAVSFSDARPQL